MSVRSGFVVVVVVNLQTPDGSETETETNEQFSCCGYFAANDTLEVGGTFCTSQDFANSLPTNNTANFCVTPVTAFTDYALENTFTCVLFLYLLHFLFSYSFAPSPSSILPQTTLYFPHHLTFVLFVFSLSTLRLAFNPYSLFLFLVIPVAWKLTQPSHLLPSSTATLGRLSIISSVSTSFP